MNITIDQIKSLRERTGISIGACKAALEEAGGDENKAIEILRKKGAAKAADRSDRSTAFGVVAVAMGSGKAALVALGCETDFVAKNADFMKVAQNLANRILEEGEEANLEGEISELNIQMGEKIEVVNKKLLSAPIIGSYIHLNNRIGVLTAGSDIDKAVADDISMHIAAMKPTNLSPDDVDAAAVAKEKEIWKEQLAQEGKPVEIMEKIMMGKEKKFREESALLTQPFAKNPEQKIQDLLKGGKVLEFVRFEV